MEKMLEYYFYLQKFSRIYILNCIKHLIKNKDFLQFYLTRRHTQII